MDFFSEAVQKTRKAIDNVLVILDKIHLSLALFTAKYGVPSFIPSI